MIASTKEPAMSRLAKSFLTNQSGATAIEYALLSSLIALALVAVLTALGTRLSSEFSEVSGALK
jgi:pilus assembly protein Flp/PilA